MNDLTLQERLQSLDPTIPQSKVEETLDLVEYWRAISKRRWSILGLTVLVAILAMLIVSNMRPVFRGTVTMLIEQGKNKIVSIEEIYSQGTIQREYYQTQVEIIKSEDLARKVIKKLNLVTHPDFDPRQQERGWLARKLYGEPPSRSDEDVLKTVVARFKNGLQVALVRNSQLV